MRRIWAAGILAVALALGLFLGLGGSSPSGSGPTKPGSPTTAPAKPTNSSNPRLDPDWTGNGKPVTFAFAGDINFPSTTNTGERLAADPATALGPTVPELLSGANLTMANLESALTDGSCPTPQVKTYVFYAPATALTALRDAGVSLATEANNHGLDCGQGGLQMALAERAQAGYTLLGIGQNVTQAFAPFQTTIDGEKIGIIAASQVIDSDLQTAWTATTTQPGMASAYDVSALVSAVEAARKVDDTVIVYLHWGTQLQACPNAAQEPLASVLVKAGADIIVGTHAHVLLGGGYVGSAYVDYGLGNFAFYNNSPPENQSGSLVITATGRHIDQVTWRPAVIEDDLPQPLTGAEATAAVASWNQARTCTDATATPGTPLASMATETAPATPSVAQQLSVDGT